MDTSIESSASFCAMARTTGAAPPRSQAVTSRAAPTAAMAPTCSRCVVPSWRTSSAAASQPSTPAGQGGMSGSNAAAILASAIDASSQPATARRHTAAPTSADVTGRIRQRSLGGRV